MENVLDDSFLYYTSIYFCIVKGFSTDENCVVQQEQLSILRGIEDVPSDNNLKRSIPIRQKACEIFTYNKLPVTLYMYSVVRAIFICKQK